MTQLKSISFRLDYQSKIQFEFILDMFLKNMIQTKIPLSGACERLDENIASVDYS